MKKNCLYVLLLALIAQGCFVVAQEKNFSEERWQNLLNKCNEIKRKYAEQYNNRAAGDEYGRLGFIFEDDLTKKSIESGSTFANDALSSIDQGAIEFISQYLGLSVARINKFSNPSSVDRSGAMTFLSEFANSLGIAQALYEYKQIAGDSYRSEALRILTNLSENCSSR
ncbi:MAG TPA: hypothetical protein VFF04_03490 [Candidatus Babeliales bacterium]|nr:hypothetical protein [Candidatus Babeliales bacterium]